MNKKINRKKRNIFYVICNPEDLNEDVYIHLQLREGSLRARYSAKYCYRGTNDVTRTEEGIGDCAYYSYNNTKVWYITVGNLGLHKIILRKGNYMINIRDIRIKEVTYDLKLMKGCKNKFIIA